MSNRLNSNRKGRGNLGVCIPKKTTICDSLRWKTMQVNTGHQKAQSEPMGH